VKEAVDSWTVDAGITSGPLLRSINKAGRIWGQGFIPKVIWAIVKANVKSCGLTSVAPTALAPRLKSLNITTDLMLVGKVVTGQQL
jgi:hypothetical protein